ncbi:MAG TPA: DUF4266 domain-containing protein [Rudaea sp.]|jgi:hypothetical protein|nr:DUF4266 domain-containing protein [Rudaea sp.]
MRRDLRIFAVLSIGLLMAGCATTPVQPWERGRLAGWDMRWDSDPMQAAANEHAHFSKEGTSGEIGAAGGGCGCN